MSTSSSVGASWEIRRTEVRQAGPTVPRMLLGAQLRKLRESKDITRGVAGQAIWGSHTKITRMELGRTGFKLRDVADLLTLYGVMEPAVRATLLALAREANQRGWWHLYTDLVPTWFHMYLGTEQAASVIRTYEVQFVPGLLQTADYARAVIRLGHPGASEEEIRRRIELRLKRQRILHLDDYTRLWAVIDEAVLRRPIGGPAVMRGQLEHLLTMSRLRSVTLQVMPFNAGGHPAAGGAVSYVRLPEPMLPDLVYLEQLTTAVYPDRLEEVTQYQHLLNQLAVQAERPEDTERRLLRMITEPAPRG